MKGNSLLDLDVNPSRKSHLAIGGDRISYLHESIVSLILSLLSTNDAVRTSLLSKCWKYKWTFSYNMDVEDYWGIQHCEMEEFVIFVDRILQYSHHLKNVRLVCLNNYNLIHVAKWITALLRHNLESFEIFYQVKGVVLPPGVLNSSLLRKLDLNIPCTLNVTGSNRLPNLTSLSLHLVEIRNENSNSDELIFTLPVLETWNVRYCRWLNVKTVEIFAPLLTTFISKTRFSEESEYSIVIHGARLATIECLGGSPENITLNGSSVLSASLLGESEADDLQVLRDIGLRVRRLLNRFSSLKELKLSGFIAEVSQFGPPLSRHDKLTQLTLYNSGNPGQLLEYLLAAPSLKYLSVNVFGWNHYDYDAMELVPSCIVSHLEEINFRCFHGEEPQYDLAKFLLKNGKALKKITFLARPSREMNEVLERLSTLPCCRQKPIFLLENR